MILTTRLILKHHGIKGQKWGVRNGPPYPLGSQNKSTKVKRTSKSKKHTKKSNKSRNRVYCRK